MRQTVVLIDKIKREMRAQNVTYAELARRINTSEVTVKRMFSQKNFTLRRLDQVCEATGLQLASLIRGIEAEQQQISQLTMEQEREIASDPKLCLVALCAINFWAVEEMVASYSLTEAECVKLLLRLNRLRLIELQPNNRIRLLISPTFSCLVVFAEGAIHAGDCFMKYNRTGVPESRVFCNPNREGS